MKIKQNGYRPSHRNKWLLLKDHILSPKELLLYEYYIDQMDFDYKHDLFSCFEVDFSDIASLFGYSSENSIRTKHKKLLNMGFIHKTKIRSIFTIHCPERYIAQSKKWRGQCDRYRESEMNQPIEIILQNIAQEYQLITKKVQPTEENSNKLLEKQSSRDLGSFKDVSKVTRSEEEYKQIINKGKFNTMTADDMKWIDEKQ